MQECTRLGGVVLNSIGFPVSHKPDESRRALLPSDAARVRHPGRLHFEAGYATHLGIADREYEAVGCHVVPRRTALECDVVCCPKAPQLEERDLFLQGQTLFGWIHAVQGRAVVDFLMSKGMTAVAWEDMFEAARHCFWRNNELAGEAAVLHAAQFFGRPLRGAEAALIGKGNCGRGALRMLAELGAQTTVYERHNVCNLRGELHRYDLVVNAVLWDVFRRDHLIARADLQRMRPKSMIVDISCDEHMGIESSHATSFQDPVYSVDGVLHYAIDHVPTIFFRAATEAISAVLPPYIDELVTGDHGECLRRATVIAGGKIVDKRIEKFQKRGPRRQRAITRRIPASPEQPILR